MHLSHLCLASVLCSASSFTPNAFITSKTNSHAVTTTTTTPPATQRTQRTTALYLEGQEPVNNFLGPETLPGAPDKLPPAPEVDEDNPGGGTLYRQMMERAKKGRQIPRGAEPMQQQQQQPMQQPMQPPQPQYGAVPQQQQPQYGAVPPPQQQQQAGMDPYATYQAQLQAWQQQMAAFAQFSAANPEAAANMAMPPPPQMPGTAPPPPAQPQQQFQAPPPVQPAQPAQPAPVAPVQPADPNAPLDPYAYLPKGDGRNSQAYEVNNTADVYFAQLKRDSSVRIEARKAGNDDAANNVMGDVGVKALSGLLSDELMESRRKRLEESGGEFETSRDEMILPAHFIGNDEEVDKSYTGVSYKESLKNSKNRQGGSAAGDAPAAPAAPAAVTPAAPVPAATSEVVPKYSTPKEPTAEEEQQQKEFEAQFSLPVLDEDDMDEIPAPSMEDSEETRKAVRTLMGLLIKHRGGPGFGHGRLVGDEAARLEATVPDIVSLVASEAGVTVEPLPPPATITTVEATPVAAPVMDRAQMTPLGGAVACVEAATEMYKNADKSTQGTLLMPLRDALLSAVNTINTVVAEGELSIAQSQASAPSAPAPVETPAAPAPVVPEPVPEPEPAPEPVYATTMEFPETYQTQTVRPEEEDLQEIAEVIANSSTDSGSAVLSENTARLQKTLAALKAISGDEKLGLRDVSKEEIEDARNAVIDMRTVLMEELDSTSVST